MKHVIWVLWPSFVAAGIAEVVFFTVIDPQQLYLFGQPVSLSPVATYSFGFLMLWLVCIGASLITWSMLPRDVKSALGRRAGERDEAQHRR